MDTDLIGRIGVLLLFPIAVFTFVKMMYHSWFVATGIRSDKTLQAGLLGPFALFVPALFDQGTQFHRRRLNIWLPACLVSFAAIFLLQELCGIAP